MAGVGVDVSGVNVGYGDVAVVVGDVVVVADFCVVVVAVVTRVGGGGVGDVGGVCVVVFSF